MGQHQQLVHAKLCEALVVAKPLSDNVSDSSHKISDLLVVLLVIQLVSHLSLSVVW
jgi:hypothetical protein